MSLVQPVSAQTDDSPEQVQPAGAVGGRRLERFIGAVVAAGACVLLASLPVLVSPMFLRVLPFLLLAVITERLTDLQLGKVKMSLGAVAIMAAAALGGPAFGALAGMISALAAWYFAPTSLMKGGFNTGMVTLGGAAAGVPILFMSNSLALNLPSALLGTAIGLIYFVVNTVCWRW